MDKCRSGQTQDRDKRKFGADSRPTSMSQTAASTADSRRC